MFGHIACIAAALLGIDAGWQPLPDGGVVYLIQIEPHVFDRLQSGEITAVESDIPPYVKEIRTYRITMGTAELPRELPPANVPEPAAPANPPEATDSRLDAAQTDPFVRAPVPETVGPEPADAMPPLWPPKAEPPSMPEAIDVAPTVKPLEAQQATYVTPAKPPKSDAPPATEDQSQAEAPAEKPWLPLTLTLLALFASLGGNLFLGWIAWDHRSRYRTLLLRAEAS